MLSKFTSNLSNTGMKFFSHLPKVYNPLETKSAMRFIKKTGRLTIINDSNNGDSLADIQKILDLMKKFTDCIQVQRIACHALSNLAMQIVAARFIVQQNGFQLIRKCMLKYDNDEKLCWLGSSAIWNLARPPANRNAIGKQGCQLMLKVLSKHHKNERVTNTAIGALSNLSLFDELKDLVSQPNNLSIVLNVLKEYAASNTSKHVSRSVMTSGTGLIANLAVSDDHANTLIKENTLPILLNILKNKIINTRQRSKEEEQESTLYRNTCAALNNLVTASNFLDNILHSRGIEILYSFLQSSKKENTTFSNLLENCLVTMDCDINKPTTSFHMSAYHNKCDILKQLIKQNNDEFDLNTKDENKMTALDYAMMNSNELSNECVKLLSKCGATKYDQKKKTNNNSDNESNVNEQFEETIKEGTQILQEIKEENKQVLMDSLTQFPEDICGFMVGFQGNVDLLQGKKMF